MRDFLTPTDDSAATIQLHSLAKFCKVRPIVVLRSGMQTDARTLTAYLGLEVRLLTKLSITFRCMDWKIGSIKYLWLVKGTFHVNLTATFHAL